MTSELTTQQSNVVAVHSKVLATKTELKIADDATYDDYLEIGEIIKQIEDATGWWWGDWLNGMELQHGKTYDELVEKTGRSKNTLKILKYVSGRFKSFNRLNDLTWTHHFAVASLPQEIRDKMLNKAKQDKLSVGELRQAVRQYKRELAAAAAPDMPDDIYRVIYADPPWMYTQDQHSHEEQETVIGTHYQSMTIEELCNLQIPKTDTDAVLFMWTTSTHLESSFDVISAWGFTYKASIIWNKLAHNVGHYVSVRHEFLLICTKGSCVPDSGKLLPSVVDRERTEHSEKPDRFREMIDDMYTYGNRIELFARKEVEGWDRWGNE